MKRYGRLIAMVAVVVVTIGTFYIQSAVSANDLPEITVEKVSGDAAEMDPVTITGNYVVEDSRAEYIQIDETGSTYDREQSLFQRLQNNLYENDIHRLQEEYRDFMRGKSGAVSSYVETDEALAYAGVANQTVAGENRAKLEVAVLDKTSGETTSLTVPVPDEDMYDFLFVEDVQMTDDSVSVLTRNTERRSGEDEKHLYRVDLRKQVITDDDTIMSADSTEEDEVSHTDVLSGSDPTAAYDEIIFETMTEPIAQGGNTDTQPQDDEKAYDYHIYDPEADEMTSLDLPEDLADQQVLDRDNTALYFQGDQQIVVYNIQKEQITQELEIPSSTQADDDGETGPTIQVRHDKAYILTRDQKAPQRLFVLDLTSGDTLFAGTIELDKPVGDNASLQIGGLSIQ